VILLLFLLAQLLAELDGVVPRNLLDGKIIGSEVAGVGSHDRVPLLLGDCRVREQERRGNQDLVLGFILKPTIFVSGAPHHEFARLDPDEVDAQAVDEFSGAITG